MLGSCATVSITLPHRKITIFPNLWYKKWVRSKNGVIILYYNMAQILDAQEFLIWRVLFLTHANFGGAFWYDIYLTPGDLLPHCTKQFSCSEKDVFISIYARPFCIIRRARGFHAFRHEVG